VPTRRSPIGYVLRERTPCRSAAHYATSPEQTPANEVAEGASRHPRSSCRHTRLPRPTHQHVRRVQSPHSVQSRALVCSTHNKESRRASDPLQRTKQLGRRTVTVCQRHPVCASAAVKAFCCCQLCRMQGNSDSGMLQNKMFLERMRWGNVRPLGDAGRVLASLSGT
jgi:hypothetical protein